MADSYPLLVRLAIADCPDGPILSIAEECTDGDFEYILVSPKYHRCIHAIGRTKFRCAVMQCGYHIYPFFFYAERGNLDVRVRFDEANGGTKLSVNPGHGNKH